MHVVCEDAISFLNAFHSEQSEIVIGLLILTQRRDDLTLFHELLRGVSEIDSVLGNGVGLFLFHPGDSVISKQEGGTLRVLAGERIDAPMQIGPETRANSFYRSASLSGVPHKIIGEQVAQSSVSVVPELCAALAIDLEEIPCVCALVKGVPGAIVCRADDRLSFSALVRAARNLQPYVNQIQFLYHDLTYDLPRLKERISEIEEFQNREMRYTEKILRLSSDLENNHSVTILPQVHAFLNTKLISPDRYLDILSTLPSNKKEAIQSDRRIRGVLNTIKKLSKLYSDLAGYLDKVDGNRQKLKLTHTDFQRAIDSSFADAGITMRRYQDMIAPISKAAAIAVPIARAADMLRRLVVPAP